MYSGCQYIMLVAALLSTTAQASSMMAKLVDGSFVEWNLDRRAPAAGFPLTLTNHNDMSYLTTVLMGTPFQAVDMAPSLSQNFISVAAAPFGVSSNSYYNPAASSSYKPENDVGSLPSISGQNITGRFAGETCMLNFANAASFGYNASVVLTNNTVADDLYPVGAKACLGYGITGPTTPANASLIPSFLTALAPNFTLAICGIELNHKDDPVPDGIFTMGAIDQSAFTGNFTNVNVPATSTVSWSIPFDSISFLSSGTAQSLPGMLVSVDLYHTVIQVSTAIASQIYAGIPGSQAMSDNAWSVPCNSKFPLSLTFGGNQFAINERDTVVTLSNGTCQGAVTGGAQAIGKVGAPFMRNFYTQFGVQKFTNGTASIFVGFAAKNLRTQPSYVTTTVLSPTTVTALGPTNTGSTSGAFRIVVEDLVLLSALAIASIVASIL